MLDSVKVYVDSKEVIIKKGITLLELRCMIVCIYIKL